MKSTLLNLLTFAALALLAPLHAADDPRLAKLSAADDERVAAMRAADGTKLAAILSDELRYAHSNGLVDNKDSFIGTLASGRTKYVGYEYEERKFTFPAPGIALMIGRTKIKAETAAGTVDSVLGFLGVWREEQGQWRFLAWQSCKLPPPAAPVAK
jgi:hypothetical protein